MNRSKVTRQIKEYAVSLGYLECGMTDTSDFNTFITQLELRMQQFPESKIDYDGLQKRGCPTKIVDWAKSIIVCIEHYGKYKIPLVLSGLIGKYYLCDAAADLDYTEGYTRKQEFNAFLDQLGIHYLEDKVTARWSAARAGVGNFGKNNFIYSHKGSWIRIFTWLVDHDLENDTPHLECECPENCTTCIDACPSNALDGPFSMNCRICIANLSYDYELYSKEEQWGNMGRWLYGCDVCQDVCPRNKGKWEHNIDFPRLSELANAIDLETLYVQHDDYFENVMYPRFNYIEPEQFWLWRCNILRSMAHSKEKRYLKVIQEACTSDVPQIKKMATWALTVFET